MDSSAEESGRVLFMDGANALVLEVGELPPLPEPLSPMFALSSSLAVSGGLRPIDRSMPSIVDAESLKSAVLSPPYNIFQELTNILYQREDVFEHLESCNGERDRLLEHLNLALGQVDAVSSELHFARRENARLSSACNSLSAANLDTRNECSLLRNEHSTALVELTTTKAELNSTKENLAGSRKDYHAALATIGQLEYISSGKQIVLWKFIDELLSEIQELKNGKTVQQIDDTITPKIEDARAEDYPRLPSGEPTTIAVIEESMRLLGPFPKLGRSSITRDDEMSEASTIIQLDSVSEKASSSHRESLEHKDEISPASPLKEPVVASPTWAELVSGKKGKALASTPSKPIKPVKPNLSINSDSAEKELMREPPCPSSKKSGQGSKVVVAFNPIAQAFFPSSPTKSPASAPSTVLPSSSAPPKVASPTSVVLSTAVASSSSIVPSASIAREPSLIPSTALINLTVPVEQHDYVPAAKMVPIYPLGPVPSSIMRYPDNHPVFQAPRPPMLPLGLGPTHHEVTSGIIEDRAEYLIQEALEMPQLMLDLCINTLAPQFRHICPISISGGVCKVLGCRLRKVCDLYSDESFLSGSCDGGCGMVHISKTCRSEIEDRSHLCIIYNRVRGLSSQDTLFRQIHTTKWAHKRNVSEGEWRSRMILADLRPHHHIGRYTR